MDLYIYLAFTGAETAAMTKHSGKTAWLGCHFSPYSDGLSILAAPRSHCHMLILTDETPIDSHDPQKVAGQLTEAAQHMGSERILLDFQRPRSVLSDRIVKAILDAADCPVGVAEGHAAGFDCPVLLSPPPLWTSLEEHLRNWEGREIWLEAATETACITVNKARSSYTPCAPAGSFPFHDESLAISYRVETGDAEARIYARRGTQQLQTLLNAAGQLGIRTAVGLYQQLAALAIT